MVTCNHQEKVSSSQKVYCEFFYKKNLIWRYAELNCLLVGFDLIPLNLELQQDDRTVCCGHNTVNQKPSNVYIQPLETLNISAN